LLALALYVPLNVLALYTVLFTVNVMAAAGESPIAATEMPNVAANRAALGSSSPRLLPERGITAKI
jgi:hypothetical protein